MSEVPFPTQYQELEALVEAGSAYADDTHELLRTLRRTATTHEQRARSTWLEAKWLDKVGREAEALIALDTALGLCRGDQLLFADVLALRACILAKQGQMMAANEAARSALEKNPAHVEARLALAHVYFDVQEPRRAINFYHEVLPLLGDPVERAEIHLTIAEAYRQLGLPVLARTHARAALNMSAREDVVLPLGLQVRAIWLRASSLARVTRWLTLLAVSTLLVSAIVGGMTWTVGVLGGLAVVLGAGAVAWFTTPVVQRTEAPTEERSRVELEEREEPAT